MDVTFDYEYGGKVFFGRIYRPVAKVRFQSPISSRWVDAWMVVDTGADFSLLPRYLALKLGISFERDCVKDVTYGVGGEQTIYLLKKLVKSMVGSIERSVPIGFFESDEVPALLGRLGFLETFDVEFLKRHTVVFKD